MRNSSKDPDGDRISAAARRLLEADPGATRFFVIVWIGYVVTIMFIASR